MDKEYILCAAIYYHDVDLESGLPKNLTKGLVICGRRHHNVIHTYYRLTGKTTLAEHIQGFMTSQDRFVNRVEAMQIAREAEQVPLSQSFNELYSEDLY